jgi:hypothetical protein
LLILLGQGAVICGITISLKQQMEDSTQFIAMHKLSMVASSVVMMM